MAPRKRVTVQSIQATERFLGETKVRVPVLLKFWKLLDRRVQYQHMHALIAWLDEALFYLAVLREIVEQTERPRKKARKRAKRAARPLKRHS